MGVAAAGMVSTVWLQVRSMLGYIDIKYVQRRYDIGIGNSLSRAKSPLWQAILDSFPLQW